MSDRPRRRRRDRCSPRIDARPRECSAAAAPPSPEPRFSRAREALRWAVEALVGGPLWVE